MGALSDFVSSEPVFENALLHIVDEKPASTNAGSSTTPFVTRILNTIKTNEITGSSLSGNTITLPAGRYYIEASAPGVGSNGHMLTLYNNSAATYAHGTSQYCDANSLINSRSTVSLRFSVTTGNHDFSLRHFFSSTRTSSGLGLGSNTGNPEIYTDVKIWRLGDL